MKILTYPIILTILTIALTFLCSSTRAEEGISAAAYGTVDSAITFTAGPLSEDPDAVYLWSFDDETTATGETVIHTFTKVDRYLVRLTITEGGNELPEVHHYINIGRPYEQTILPLAGTEFTPSTNGEADFSSWLDCPAEWNIYYGKYTTLWMQADADHLVDRQHIINALIVTDFFFDNYSDIMGWDFVPGNDALNLHYCDGVVGGGTGTGGTFFNIEELYGEATQEIEIKDYGGFAHENLHLWDFRGGAWLSSNDTAHAFTAGMEPIVNSLLGTGQTFSHWGGDSEALTALAPDFIFNHYFRIALGRYLSHPELDWSTYSSYEFVNTLYDDLNIPENKEHMLVPGGILMSILNMHGREGLKSVLMQIEKILQTDTGLFDADLSRLERTKLFMRATADGLELDVSDYFTFWKYPVDVLSDYMSKYPTSSKINDNDGDGVSSLEGDLNDNDASIFPYAPELIDGKDNNQDGLIDETVYTEDGGDIDSINITLPAQINANLDDLADEDSFVFTLAEDAAVTFTVYPKDSDSVVAYKPDSNRQVSIISGSMYLDGGGYTELIHDAMSAPESISAKFLTAGTHTIRIAAIGMNGINPNPGSYEIQVFINEYGPGFTASSLLAEIYPLSSSSEIDDVNITHNEGEEVSLDALAMTSAAGENLSFDWQQISGASVEIPNSGPQIFIFTTPFVTEQETLVFKVAVSNERDVVTATVNVLVLHELGNSDISVSPTSHDFGNTTVGNPSTSQTFTVTNNGDGELVIDTITISSEGMGTCDAIGGPVIDTDSFLIQNDNCSGKTLAQLESCTIDILFTPTSEDDIIANLSITSNDPGTPILNVSLSGTGNDDDGLSAPANFSSSVEECYTSTFGTSCTVSLSWTGVSAATGYKLYYGYSSGSYEAPVDLGNVTSVTFNGVPGGTYYLAVSAYDSSSESNKSEEIALVVGGSSVPTSFSATVSDCTEDTLGITICTVSLSWAGVSGSSGYYLYYGFSSGNYAGSIDVGSVTSLTFTGIVEGIYYLALTTYDSFGVESGYSDELILEVGSNSVNRVERGSSPFTR